MAQASPRVKRLVQLGLQHARLGRAERARAAFALAERLAPDDPDIQMLFCEFCAGRGRLDEALVHCRRAARLDSGRPEIWLMQQDLLERAGRPAQAEACLRAALRLAPGSAQTRLRYGEFCFKNGRCRDAVRHLERALALGCPQPEVRIALTNARIGLAEELEKAGRLGEAEALWRLAERTAPSAAQVRLRRVRCLMALSRLKEREGLAREAESCLRRADRVSRREPAAQSELGRLHEQRGRLRLAAAHLRRAAALAREDARPHLAWVEFLKDRGRYADAARHLAGLRRRRPAFWSAELEFQAGWVWGKDEAYGRMLRHFRLCVRHPGFPQVAGFHRLTALLCLRDYRAAGAAAEELLDAGCAGDWLKFFLPWPQSWLRPTAHRFLRAELRALARETVRHPAAPWPRFFKGTVLYSLGLLAQSLPEFAALRGLPQRRYGWMRYYAGLILLNQCRYKEARRELAAAAAHAPGFWLSLCHSAEAMLCLGLPRQATAIFAQARQAAAGSAAEPHILAWEGETLLWTGDYAAALARLKSAVDAGSWLAVCWRGAALMLSGRYREALRDLDRAIVPGSRDAEALVWRGELHRRMGRLRAARSDLDRAVELEGGDWAYWNRALLAAAMDRPADMRRDMARIAPEALRHVRGGLKLPEGAETDMRKAVAILAAGLRLARGVRRSDAYLRALWMAADRPRPGSPRRFGMMSRVEVDKG
ncbi:MAG: tetratricopeptide repeat protein [Elusimicrobia bacterium]|nr:tetratricopeptide repeat protein [Elusimicrobiota bacterium]